MKRFLGALAALLAFPTLALAQVPHAFAGLRGNVPASYLDDNFAYLYTNKLSVTLSSGQLLVGNGSNVATARTPSGDCTLSNTGVFSCGPFLRISSNLSDLANASTARTNLGVAIGTNVQAWDADLDALAALSGTNTIYYRSGANTWSPVTIGTNLVFSAGTLTASGGVSTALTSAHTLIGNASNVATDTAISGDATLANTGALTLATVNGSPGSYGAAWSIPTFTADAKGRLTAAGATTPTIPSSTVTGAMLASGAASTNLSLGTGVATLLTGSASGTGGPAGTTSPTFITPNLGTVASGTLTGATGLPISTGVSGLGSGVATLLGTPSSANLAAALTDETGTGLAVFNNGASLTNPALTNTSVMGNYANWLAGEGLANFVTPEQLGAKGDGTTDDTAAWTSATGTAGRSIYCRPGATYLIASTVTITVNNVHLYGKCVFKAKMGAGGFNSVELNTNRYTSEPVIYWSAVDGGGFEYIEVYPSAYPGAGGDYALIPVAVRSGMATQPFVAGTLYVHDTTGLPSGDLAIDSIGAAGLSIDHVNCINFGTDYTGWTYNGGTPPYGSISPLCLHVDTDRPGALSSRLQLGSLYGTNGYLGPDAYAIAGEQTSFMVLGGTGGTIGSVDYTGQGQGIDIQSSNWIVGPVNCANVMICYKMGYGASSNLIGKTNVSNSLLQAVLFYGNSNSATTTGNNSVGPLSGNLIAERSQLAGTLVSATSTTAVLPVAAVAVDNYYRAGYEVHMTSGTHSGSECAITGYVGSTKTVTCSGGWTSGTPTTGDSFTILGIDASHRTAVFWGQESLGLVVNNQVAMDKITNGGLRTYDAYSNITAGGSIGNGYLLSTACGGIAVGTVGGTGAGVTPSSPVCAPLATVATSGLASDLTGTLTGAQLPNPTASTKGGVESLVATTHQFINTISTSGVPASAQPACADLSNAGTACPANTGTSGATIPLLNGANTWSGVQSINSGDLGLKGATSGTLTLNAATTAGSNTLTLPAGTTDFSATGGTSQVVKQTSTGGAFTVARLACADLSNAGTSCPVNTGTSGATIPLLNAGNTFSAQQAFQNSSSGVATIAAALSNPNAATSSEVALDLTTNNSGAGVRSAQVAAKFTTGTGNELHLRTNPNAAAPTDVMILKDTDHLLTPPNSGVFGGGSVSACGTTPGTTDINDIRGTITTGSGTVTSCVYNFANTYSTAPHCTASLHSSTAYAGISAITTSSVTFSFSASSPSTALEFICIG